MHRANPVVVPGSLERINDVLHEGLGLRLTHEFSDSPVIGITRKLLDERADRLNDERCVARQDMRRFPGHHAEEQHEDEQQEQQVQQFSQAVEATPHGTEEPNQNIPATHQ
jgi:hypothetical protein